MSSKRYTQEQILKVLKEIEAGATIASVARTHGVNVQTLYQWRKRYAGMGTSELAELKALQEENRRLKRRVPATNPLTSDLGRRGSDLARPTFPQANGSNQTWTYDAAGNRTSDYSGAGGSVSF